MPSSKELPPLMAPLIPNQFVKAQFCYKPVLPPADTDLTGKVIIVTAANSGLGLESSRQFLSYKLSRLIVAVRSLEKGKAAAAELQEAYPKATIEVWKLDMSSTASIKAFVARVESDLTRLDVAVLNAGLMPFKVALNPETGYEDAIHVNYLATMLLTSLLLPALKSKSSPRTPGRVVIVSSIMAATCKLPDRNTKQLLHYFSDFSKRKLDMTGQYSVSKLLQMMYLWKLAEYVPSRDVIVNAVEPGALKGTNFNSSAPAALRLVGNAFANSVGRPVKDGATTVVDAALNHGSDAHGSLLMNWEIRS